MALTAPSPQTSGWTAADVVATLKGHRMLGLSALVAVVLFAIDVLGDDLPLGLLVTALVFVLGAIADSARRHDEVLSNLQALLENQAQPVLDTREDVAFLRSVNADVETLNYDNETEFFNALRYALGRARGSVLVTQIRDQPPGQQGEAAAAWAKELTAWADQGTNVVQRVMSLPNDDMREWARNQLSDRKAGAALATRAVNGEKGVPAINLAIFDEQAVFVILTSKDQMSFQGIGISSAKVARYFKGHFEVLWNAAKPIEDVL